MLAVLALLLSNAFPSTSRTSWMRPESFRLSIGMSRAEAIRSLEESGWKAKQAEDADHFVVDYTSNKSFTLEFRHDRLRSIRFELYALLHEIGGAFAEEKSYLRSALGEPKQMKSKSIVLYDGVLPNVMVVASADPKSESGKRGLGVLVVRYYDPRP